MTFDASHALRFINRARAATGLPALTELPFTGAVRVDERACLLARALQAEVGGSADPRFRDHFVVRLGDQALARAVASRTGQPCNDHAEVLLPEPLARLAVAFDRGQVERRAARYVPLGQLSFDDLETAACQAVAVVSDSSAGHEQALSAVHDHPSSAAHGGRAGGQRTRAERTPPGPPVPTTTPSIRMAWRPTSRYVWFRGHAALCFKRRAPGTERRPKGGTSPSTANSLSCMSAPFDAAGEALRRLPTRACEDRRLSRRPRTA